MVCEKNNSIIGVMWEQENPNPQVHRPMGNLESLVSH